MLLLLSYSNVSLSAHFFPRSLFFIILFSFYSFIRSYIVVFVVYHSFNIRLRSTFKSSTVFYGYVQYIAHIYNALETRCLNANANKNNDWLWNRIFNDHFLCKSEWVCAVNVWETPYFVLIFSLILLFVFFSSLLSCVLYLDLSLLQSVCKYCIELRWMMFCECMNSKTGLD